MASRKNTSRRAGILMHITSLPAEFGTGDLGPEAFKFAAFLAHAGQSYWQILPLNPTTPEGLFSPYSSTSAFAGNPLLISPDELHRDAWLPHSPQNAATPPLGKVDFARAAKVREEMFQHAFSTYAAKAESSQSLRFEEFKRREQYWLHDFALYQLLKDTFKKPWYQWKETYRNRDAAALAEVVKHESQTLEKIKWLQFVFHKQWKRIKNYCNAIGVKIVGDLPFYVAHDSADVWSHKELFDLDESGMAKNVAGVPPDYFNSKGQLWGMPVFYWPNHKAQGYEWWLKRIEKNLMFFDVLRLDHFRAFSSYWSVPADAENAVEGTWEKGCGEEFLKKVQQQFPEMPFVAEDLGDVDDEVYALRDAFNLPGMKVIQFAFGDKMPTSGHIPHNFERNFFAYTGTHDNDTTRGWFTHGLDPAGQMQVSAYCRKPVHKNNVHREMMAQIFSSVAHTAIVPIQDVFGLGSEARMNSPASSSGNWLWRLLPEHNYSAYSERLYRLAELYNRLPQKS